ncbi:MAG: hypothetical protein ACPLPR_01285 [Bacillota bacterium]
MRRALTFLLAALVLAAAPSFVRAQGLPPLIWVEDDYLDFSKTDSLRTTAVVDTVPPGLVVLPREWGRVALHPSEMSLVAAAPDGLRGYGFDGSRLVRDSRLDASFPGVFAAAFSSDGRFLAAVSSSGEVRVWGRDPEGVLRQVASLSGFAGAVALEPAFGADFWVVGSTWARYLGFDGSSWREVGAFRLLLSGAVSGSWYAPRGLLAVLDAGRVRCFGFDGATFREVPAFGVPAEGASGVVQHGIGYGVVVGDRVLCYGFGPEGVVRVPSLDVVLPEACFGGAVSLWGDLDFVVVTDWGARYLAWSGSGWCFDPARSLSGEVWGGYRPSAEYRSVVVASEVPVELVYLEAEYQVPSGCGLVFQVSTDGGFTWTDAVPSEVQEVPSGPSLGYRALLSSPDPAVTPSIDRVTLLQIGRYSLPPKVRLIR